jgi:transposase
MSKRFRPWDPKQKWLLPPEITEFIPEGHPAHFVRDLVVEQLDLSAILDTYDEERGYPPFHPAMMVALLRYAYTQGVFSSRKIAKACIERMDFAAVTGFQKPDFRTVGLFRRRHLVALAGLFQQVLVLCRYSDRSNRPWGSASSFSGDWPRSRPSGAWSALPTTS